MRIALVHDALNQFGGAEQVLRAFNDAFPHAPICTLVDDGKVRRRYFPKADVRTSFLQRLPLGVRSYKLTLPLHPTAFEHFDLSDYDVVLSDTAAFAKGVVTRPETIHVCYCHTPPRFLWHDTHNYTEDLHAGRLVKKLLPLALTWLRSWDQLAAQRVDRFVANSHATARRINKYYGRDARVIYPPVAWDDFRIEPVESLGDYYLMVGRFRPYKKFDLAIRAFNKLGLPLVILGSGEEAKHLRKIAGPNVTFVPDVTDQKTKSRLFARAQAFIHPHEEDFGIAAVESMAAGRPVIAFGRGGALETVVPGLTGVFFNEQSEDALIDAVRAFEPLDYDPVKIREHAKQFDVARFQREIWQVLLEARRERAQLPLPTRVTTRSLLETVKATVQV